MAFEIVDTETTQDTGATTEVDTQEVKDVNNNDSTDTGSTDDVQGNPAPEGDENSGGEDTGGNGQDDKQEPQGTEDSTYYFGGNEVEIEIPQDVEESLKEKGIDAKELVAELYSKDGDFSLSDETKQKLYDAFGKFAVDAYLSGLKAQNEMFFMNEATKAKEMEQANTQRFNDIAKEVGGDEGWTRLEEFALSTLSDEELTAFNAVMDSGNQYLQMYAVRELEARRKQAQGDDKVELVQGTPASDEGDNSPLSAQEYIREVSQIGSKFRGDRKGAAEYQAKLDARRRAGMARGL